LTVFTVCGSVHPSCCRLVSIIRSTWLYLQYLVVFTQVAASWCPSSGALDCIYSMW